MAHGVDIERQYTGFMAGAYARALGHSANLCPHVPSSGDAIAWRAGWEAFNRYQGAAIPITVERETKRDANGWPVT